MLAFPCGPAVVGPRGGESGGSPAASVAHTPDADHRKRVSRKRSPFDHNVTARSRGGTAARVGPAGSAGTSRAGGVPGRAGPSGADRWAGARGVPTLSGGSGKSVSVRGGYWPGATAAPGEGSPGAPTTRGGAGWNRRRAEAPARGAHRGPRPRSAVGEYRHRRRFRRIRPGFRLTRGAYSHVRARGAETRKSRDEPWGTRVRPGPPSRPFRDTGGGGAEPTPAGRRP